MNISATDVRFEDDTMWVELAKRRSAFEISPGGIHWDELDEDISIAGLLAGRGDQAGKRSAA